MPSCLLASITAIPAPTAAFFVLTPLTFCCCGFPFSLVVLVFWVWMLLDSIQFEKPGTEKIVWVLVIIFLHLLGAIIYFFVRYKKNRFPDAGAGAGPSAAPPGAS